MTATAIPHMAKAKSIGAPGTGFTPFKTGTDIAWTMLEPDACMPAQFFASRASNGHQQSGEWRLCEALLMQAVKDLHDVVRRAPATHRMIRQAADAWAWLFTDTSEPLSCAVICAALGIDLDALRARWRTSSVGRQVQIAIGAGAAVSRRDEHA